MPGASTLMLTQWSCSIKASENQCDDHKSNVSSLKNTFLQLFLYFSAQIETENYKLIYELQFKHFIKWGKICITFGTFYDKF